MSAEERAPFINQAFVVLTNRCNYQCSHCVFACRPRGSRSLDTEVLGDWLLAAATHDFRLVDLSGGEPLTHPGFEALVERLIDQTKMEISVASNLALINRLDHRLISDACHRFRWRLAVEAEDEAEHDAIRARGAFRTLWSGVDHLQSLGHNNIVCNTIIRPGNVEKIESIARLVHARGIPRHNWIGVLPFGRSADNPAWHVPPAIWFGKLRTIAASLRQALGLDIQISGPVLMGNDRRVTMRDEFIYRGYRSRAVVILNDGRIYCDCFKDAFIHRRALPGDHISQTIAAARERYPRLPCTCCEYRFACNGLTE